MGLVIGDASVFWLGGHLNTDGWDERMGICVI